MQNESECSVRSYSIELSNNQVWHLTSASQELHPWMDKVASIMEFDASPTEEINQQINSFNSGDLSGKEDQKQPYEHHSGWQCQEIDTLRIWQHDDVHNVMYTVKPFSSKLAEVLATRNALYPVYREYINLGGQLFHAGLIEFDGKGVIIAGRSGAGKSTSCRRLRDGWKALSDDELLMVPVNGGTYRAHPLPTWSEYLEGDSEKTWNIQYSVPVCAIFFIEQSDVDAATLLGEGEAASWVNDSSLQAYSNYGYMHVDKNKKTLRRKIFDNSCEIARIIPAFRLKVTLHGSFWKEIERVLGW